MFHPIPLSPPRSHKPHPALHGTVVQEFQIAIVVQRGKRVIEFFFFVEGGLRVSQLGVAAERWGEEIHTLALTLLLDGGSPCDTY